MTTVSTVELYIYKAYYLLFQATKKYFKEIGAKERSHLEVEFKKNKITLDIPMAGGVTIGEWNLLPTVTPCVS